MGGPGKVDGKSLKELDNFYKCYFIVGDKTYCSSENYFQCQKATNDKDFEMLNKSGPGVMVWSNSRKIRLRKDWDKIRVDMMYEANYEKFVQNDELKKVLIDTKGDIAITDSSTFWNYWNGRILMRIRAELRKNGEEDDIMIEKITKEMEEYKINN